MRKLESVYIDYKNWKVEDETDEEELEQIL